MHNAPTQREKTNTSNIQQSIVSMDDSYDPYERNIIFKMHTHVKKEEKQEIVRNAERT